MIIAQFNDNVISFSGHAETAPIGEDLVCAAASGIVTTFINGLHLFSWSFEVVEHSATNETIIEFSNTYPVVEKYVAATIIGLKQLEKQHPQAIEVSVSNEYRKYLDKVEL